MCQKAICVILIVKLQVVNNIREMLQYNATGHNTVIFLKISIISRNTVFIHSFDYRQLKLYVWISKS